MTDHETLVPRMAGTLEETKLRALPLAAVDRFVLSLVDGATSVRILAETVGLATEDVIASLLKLEALGVIALPSSSSPPRAPRAAYPRAPHRCRTGIRSGHPLHVLVPGSAAQCSRDAGRPARRA